MKVAHLLDDFGMGGVTRALTLFSRPELREIADSTIIPVNKDAMIAPCIDADVIVDHMAASWRRLPYLASLRARNRNRHIVRVEHSYTAGFERKNVQATDRFRSMLRISGSLADEMVCVSNAQRIWMTDVVGVQSSKVRTVYPWSGRTDLFKIETRPARNGAPLQLLAYGRFAEVKNFAELVIAMRSFKLEEVQLTLFGDGPQERLLNALAARSSNVRVLGPQDDPSQWLKGSDAVILPSHYEAFGLVATEARMAARPIIVADVDGLPEQAREGGIVANLSSAYDIARAVRRATRTRLSELGVQARQSVRGQHQAILDGWVELLQGAVSEPTTVPVHDVFQARRLMG